MTSKKKLKSVVCCYLTKYVHVQHCCTTFTIIFLYRLLGIKEKYFCCFYFLSKWKKKNEQTNSIFYLQMLKYVFAQTIDLIRENLEIFNSIITFKKKTNKSLLVRYIGNKVTGHSTRKDGGRHKSFALGAIIAFLSSFIA